MLASRFAERVGFSFALGRPYLLSAVSIVTLESPWSHLRSEGVELQHATDNSSVHTKQHASETGLTLSAELLYANPKYETHAGTEQEHPEVVDLFRIMLDSIIADDLLDDTHLVCRSICRRSVGRSAASQSIVRRPDFEHNEQRKQSGGRCAF